MDLMNAKIIFFEILLCFTLTNINANQVQNQIDSSKIIIKTDTIFVEDGFQITPLEMEQIINDIVTANSKRLDWIIGIAAAILTIITLTFTIASSISQRNSNKDYKELFERISNEQKELIQERINLIKFEDIINKRLQELFDEKYPKVIYENTKRIAYDVMYNTQIQQEQISAYYKSLAVKIKKAISDGDNIANQIGDILKYFAIDWLTMSRIYSIEKEQKISGLKDFIKIHPFKELEPMLDEMKKRYKDDPDIEPLIIDALKKCREIDN